MNEEGYNIRTSYESPLPNYQMVKIVGKVKDFATGDLEDIKGHGFCQVQEYRLEDELLSRNLEEECKALQSLFNYKKEVFVSLNEVQEKGNELLEQHLSGTYDDQESVETENSRERSGNESEDDDDNDHFVDHEDGKYFDDDDDDDDESEKLFESSKSSDEEFEFEGADGISTKENNNDGNRRRRSLSDNMENARLFPVIVYQFVIHVQINLLNQKSRSSKM